jgi:hypothetical protein
LLYNAAMRFTFRPIWRLPLLIVLFIGVYFLPPVHDRLSWRVNDLYTRIKYELNPPEEAVFLPTQEVNFESVLATTRANYALTLTPQPTSTPRPGPTRRPTTTPTPGPEAVSLPGVIYVDQHNAGIIRPANATMALSLGLERPGRCGGGRPVVEHRGIYRPVWPTRT